MDNGVPLFFELPQVGGRGADRKLTSGSSVDVGSSAVPLPHAVPLASAEIYSSIVG